MSLIDDFSDIVDDPEESTESHIYNIQKENRFEEWYKTIKNIKQTITVNYNTKTIHNMDSIIMNNDKLTIIFNMDILKNSFQNMLVCPVTFISECPKFIDNIDIINKNKPETYCLVLYSPKTYNDITFKYDDYILTEDGIINIEQIVYNNLNITDVIFRGTFESIDVYNKFVNIFRNIKGIKIWIHYDSKIDGNNSQMFSSFILGSDNIDQITYNGTVKVSYASFVNDCVIE